MSDIMVLAEHRKTGDFRAFPYEAYALLGEIAKCLDQ